MTIRVGVSTGLYTVARAEELATTLRKVGFALTRGTSAMEISGDVPHEVTETEGEEIRHLAEKQKIEILMHGSLTVPLDMPERGEWRDAHDHMQKSIKSAIYSGAKYVNFHACLNIWLELMTYAGRKLTMSFCDHEGRFISHILAENEKLREWFVKERWNDFLGDILKPEERQEAAFEADSEANSWQKNEKQKRLEQLGVPKELVHDIIMTDIVPPDLRRIESVNKVLDDIRREAAKKDSELREKYTKDAVRKRLSKKERWDSEDLRTAVGIVDGAHIMAHYMFFRNDPIWAEMWKLYPGLASKYKLDPNNLTSLDDAWRDAEEHNDKTFKEFYYGTVAAKMVEGHSKKILEWIDNELVKKEFVKDPKLQDIAKKLIITYESPDARDPSHAGLHMLWSARQMYAMIKGIRNVLKTDRIWLLMDFEHIATQGVDPIKDMEEVIKIAPDFGKYVISVHSNAPNPLHAHEPLELGDDRIYKLLWSLRKTGFGKEKDRTVYLIYERGGGKDPFVHSVEVLRLAKEFLEKDIPPEKLPLEYYGMKGAVAGDERRQMQIVRDHAWEPLKDLLEMVEEDWTFLSQSAIRKGKKPGAWKRGELR